MKARIRPTWRGYLLVLLVAAGIGAACNGSTAQVPTDGSAGADAPTERNDTGIDGGAGTGGAGGGGVSGTTGGAGSGGTGGNNGDGGSGAAGFDGFQPPGCLRDLFAPCSIAGSCAYQTDDAGNPVSRCYASGARSTSTGSRCTTNGPSVETATITKPDGTLCYTVSISASPSQACEYETHRWSDASGATVATGTTVTIPSVGISIRCEGGGETAMRSGTQPYLIFTSGQCSPGNCP